MAISKTKQVGDYQTFLYKGILENEHFPRSYELVKNLCYSITYIEYLESKIKDEENYVVKSQLIKSYILTGMSVVEGLLFYAIKSKGLFKTTDYELINTYTSNEQNLDGELMKLETKVLKKLPSPKLTDMNLESMIKKSESKKLINLDEGFYKKLNHFRKLRNSVHIQIAGYLSHDFNSFKPNDYEAMKIILLEMFKSDLFKSPVERVESLFDFLK